MSQRQLAQQSGVDHSTISRLIRGDRMPSLGTAQKLARGLRELRDDSDTSMALGVVSLGPQNPTARVEYALRADELLSEPQVRQIMEYYLAVRMRRFGRTFQAAPAERTGTASATSGNGHVRPVPALSGVAGPATSAVQTRYGVSRPAVRPPTRLPGRS
jgi:transcriptional regulator with XRE-family HTH domain